MDPGGIQTQDEHDWWSKKKNLCRTVQNQTYLFNPFFRVQQEKVRRIFFGKRVTTIFRKKLEERKIRFRLGISQTSTKHPEIDFNGAQNPYCETG